ncbi:hypothetical protein JTB14_001559 [Gonioctena quinquepunctata]|nr:hypothetical protein JTB14_001559 [Gonioctena quinquepunctata]
MVVLNKIKSESRRFPIFVAYRIRKIRDGTDISQWHWIPSDLNVADQATKELNKIDFGVHSNWLKGPKFSKLPEETWPGKPKNVLKKKLKIFLRFSNMEEFRATQDRQIFKMDSSNQINCMGTSFQESFQNSQE